MVSRPSEIMDSYRSVCLKELILLSVIATLLNSCTYSIGLVIILFNSLNIKWFYFRSLLPRVAAKLDVSPISDIIGIKECFIFKTCQIFYLSWAYWYEHFDNLLPPHPKYRKMPYFVRPPPKKKRTILSSQMFAFWRIENWSFLRGLDLTMFLIKCLKILIRL